MVFGHGDDRFLYNGKIIGDFSSNVYPGGTPKALVKHLQDLLPQIDHYPEPDGGSLTHKLSSFHQLDENAFMVTNGATEAFYLLALTFRGAHSLIFTPTFKEYEDSCFIHQHEVSFAKWGEWEQLKYHPASVVWICNPNNPTGSYENPDIILQMVDQFPEKTFIIDEAYIHFLEEGHSILSKAPGKDNLIVVRSLTKGFAIPGLRLGYLCAHPKLIEKINQGRMPWSVNTLAIEGGKYILDHWNSLFPDIKGILVARSELWTAINSLHGFSPAPSATNYFLVQLEKGNSKELKNFLAQNFQLLIRDASNFMGLNERFFRLAAQTPQLNQQLTKGLKAWKTSLL